VAAGRLQARIKIKNMGSDTDKVRFMAFSFLRSSVPNARPSLNLPLVPCHGDKSGIRIPQWSHMQSCISTLWS